MSKICICVRVCFVRMHIYVGICIFVCVCVYICMHRYVPMVMCVRKYVRLLRISACVTFSIFRHFPILTSGITIFNILQLTSFFETDRIFRIFPLLIYFTRQLSFILPFFLRSYPPSLLSPFLPPSFPLSFLPPFPPSLFLTFLP